MGDQDNLELHLRVTAEGAEKVAQVEDQTKKLGTTAAASGAAVDKLSDALKQVLPSAKSLADALKTVAGDATRFDQATRDAAASALKSTVATKEETKAKKESAAASREQSDAMKKYSDQVESYFKINLKNKLREEAEAARASARELQLSQQEVTASLRVFQGLTGALPGGLGYAGGAVSRALATPLGIGAAGAAGLILLGKQFADLAGKTGEYARAQINLAASTGLNTTQTQIFGQIANLTGVNVSGLITQVRTLSRAMSENSDEGRKAKQALKEIGLDQTVAFGDPGQAIQKIYQRLAQVPNSFDQERLTTTLLGREGLKSLPAAADFEQLQRQIRELGTVMDTDGIKKAAEYQRQLSLLSLEWEGLKRTLGSKAIGVIEIITQGRGPTIKGVIESAANAIPGGALVTGIYDTYSALHPTSPKDLQAIDPGRFGTGKFPDPLAIQRQQNADALTAANARNDGSRAGQLDSLQLKIRNAQEEYKAEQDKLGAQERAISPADLQHLNSLKAQVEALKQQVAYIGQIDSITERVAAARDRARLKSSGASGAIEEGRLAENRSLDREERDLPGFRPQFEELRKGANDAAAESQLEIIKAAINKNRTELGKYLDENLKKGLEFRSSTFETQLRKVIRQEEDDVRTGAELGRISRTSASDNLEAQIRRRQQFNRLTAPLSGDKTAGIVSTFQDNNELLNAREQAGRAEINQDPDLTANQKKIELAKLLATITKERTANELEAEQRILEVNRQQTEEARQIAGKFFDALTTKGSGGSQIGAFFQSEIKGVEKTIFQNATAGTLQRAGDSLAGSLGGQTSANGQPTLVGKLLRGTPFEAKTSPQEALVSVTQDQTSATRELTATMRAVASGQSLPPGGANSTPLSPAPITDPNFSTTVTAQAPGQSLLSRFTGAAGLGVLGAGIGYTIGEARRPQSPIVIQDPHTFKPPDPNRIFGILGGLAGFGTGLLGPLTHGNPQYGRGTSGPNVPPSPAVSAAQQQLATSTDTLTQAVQANTQALTGGTGDPTFLAGGSGGIGGIGSGPSGVLGSLESPYGIPGLTNGGIGSLASIGALGAPGYGLGGFGSLGGSADSALGVGGIPGLANGGQGSLASIGALSLDAAGPSANRSTIGSLLTGLGGSHSITATYGALTGTNGQSAAQNIGTVVGTAGVVATGVEGVISGVKEGGARGITSAIGSAAGTAAALDPEPISKGILAAVALTAGVVKDILGDPKQERANQISTALQQNQYLAPATINRTVDTQGNNVAYNSLGQAYSTPFQGYSSTATQSIYYNGQYSTIPGEQLNTFQTPQQLIAGQTNPAFTNPTPPPVPVPASASSAGSGINLTIHALDSQSIVDRADDVGQAVYVALQKGGALAGQIQSTILQG